MNKHYDFLIVGAGLFGATFARKAADAGKKCLIIEKRNHVAGNAFTENVEGVEVHVYGAHIFHTNDKKVWEFVNRFSEFNNYVNQPIANYYGEIYNLPFNMNTFSKLWNIATPQQAIDKIQEQRKDYYVENPNNLEQQAINLVGKDIYKKLIKGYTEKQWGRPCDELPPEIITRLPVRFTFDNNYFNARWQGIPESGYTGLVSSMLDGIEVELNVDFFDKKEKYSRIADKIIYTGAVDRYFEYCFGSLEYRSLRFESEVLDCANFQGNAVVNYTDPETPYTRIIEHKHFAFGVQEKTVVTKEYSKEWHAGDEPYYPIRNEKNLELYNEYKRLSNLETNVFFGGRLGRYQYYDMDQVITSALNFASEMF